MAERRMFAKTIIDSDAFLDMPISARLLYYDLGMRADDDGFINAPKKIMRTIGATTDDMNILIARKFVIPFDSGVVVIKAWRINNYLRSDRYKETNYLEEKGMLDVEQTGMYTMKDDCGIPSGIPLVDAGKDSIGKDNIKGEKAQEILDLYHKTCPSLPKVIKLTDKRIKLVNARLKEYTIEQITDVFEKAEASDFLKNGSGTWKGADFEWILNPNNFIKIMEGNYKNKTENKSGYDLYRTTKSSNYDFEALERETRR